MATVTGGVTSVSHYGWCGQRLCQSRSGTDTPLRRYLAEGEYDAAQGALIYAPDHLGSVRDVLAGSSGQSLGHFDYDPYGNATTATGSHANWPDFRYAGLFYHQTSGLYLATYRAYDPAIARWLSRDPIEEQGGLNLYAYVGGDPIGLVDMSGLAGTSSPLGPDPTASGRHSTFRRPPTGPIENYCTWENNPITNGWDPILRYRGTGKPHGGVNPPYIGELPPGKGPGSTPNVPRPAEPWV